MTTQIVNSDIQEQFNRTQVEAEKEAIQQELE